MNHLTLYGHLGRDPESQTSQNGHQFWVLNVAEHIYRKGKDDDTCWWRVAVFRTGLDGIIKSLKKGSSVIVYGEMNPPRIFESEEGEPKIALSCTAHRVCFSPFGGGAKEKDQEKEITPIKKEESAFTEDLSSVFGSKNKEEDSCPF